MRNSITKLILKSVLFSTFIFFQFSCGKDDPAPTAVTVCFEDSFNGMIAAKAAKMKCVVVPSLHDAKNPVWAAADLKISTLSNFNELLLLDIVIFKI